MIEFDRFTLNNGLRVLVHKDSSSPIVAMNIIYDVGARDEDPERTGFAHLFEHLMFGGSKNIPVYDEPLQKVGGENNAFTNNDITNYYLTLPANNLETGFWLESDRMMALDFSQKSLDVQKNVVIEEYKQRYLNQPYGDVSLLLRPLSYKVHPYRWPTIGESIEHIKDARLADVKSFFYSHYAPNNAVLSISGNVETEQIHKLTDKWFGGIEKRNIANRNLNKEPKQTGARELTEKKEVPSNAIYMAYHMCDRKSELYHATDLLSDILSNGLSSRLYQSLVKEKRLFSNINAYISGSIDPGQFIISGNLLDGVSIDEAEKAIHSQLEKLKMEEIPVEELEKVKNKLESSLVFSEISILNKAMNLGYYELLGDAQLANLEIEKYRKVLPGQMQTIAKDIFDIKNSSTLYYLSKNQN